MLETRESGKLVKIVNSFCCLKEYCLHLSVFLDEQHHLSAESPHSSEREKHCSSVREALMLQARGPCTLLCMVNWVSIWKECFLTVSVFKGEDHQLCAMQHLSSEWRSTVAFLRKALMLEARWFSSMLRIENWVCCLRQYALPLSVSMGEEHHLVHNESMQVNVRKTAVFVRESFMLETRGSSNMVSIVNSVCSLKEYCLPLSVFLDEQHHLCSESPHSSEREKHCSSCKRRINFKSKRVLHFVKHGELC
jgi:hypothetical protein